MHKPSDISERGRKELPPVPQSQDDFYKTLRLGHLYSHFILYNHKGGAGSQHGFFFYRHKDGSQKVVKGHNPLFLLFFWVILFQGANEVMFDK